MTAGVKARPGAIRPDLNPSLTARIIAALSDENHAFTRGQVALLMAEAFRWGYEHHDTETCDCHSEYWAQRTAEEEATYPPAKVHILGKWYDQAARRQQADADARNPRPGDYQPGTVVAW